MLTAGRLSEHLLHAGGASTFYLRRNQPSIPSRTETTAHPYRSPTTFLFILSLPQKLQLRLGWFEKHRVERVCRPWWKRGLSRDAAHRREQSDILCIRRRVLEAVDKDHKVREALVKNVEWGVLQLLNHAGVATQMYLSLVVRNWRQSHLEEMDHF